ncbi:MAG: hypothetical protein M1818_000178 [Claussenomyces sp. TS43310]|nr:MAG: hypothetical protein M1818_000178 [Claussenomyces sp. TS43310]
MPIVDDNLSRPSPRRSGGGGRGGSVVDEEAVKASMPFCPAVDKAEDKDTADAAIEMTAATAAATTAATHVHQEEPKSLHFKLTVIWLCVVGAMASMDSVIVAMCLENISRSLNTTSTSSFWLGTAFLLTQTVTIPIYGTLSDIFGRKPLIQIGILIFFIASIICGTAQSGAWLIGGRAAQGVGAGGLLSLCQMILSDITTMRERGKYSTISAFSWAIGILAGVPLGGLIAQFTSWRWIFWINLPLCAVSIPGLWWSLRLQTDTASFMTRIGRIDYLGLFVFSGSTTSVLIGLTCGGTLHPWHSAATVVPIVAGILGLMAFSLIEWKFAQEPMVPLRIFKDITANTAYIGVFCHGMVVWSYSYYMIVFFLGAKQRGPLLSAADTLPGFAFTNPSGVLAGFIVKATLRFKHLMIIGWILLAAGIGSNVTMLPSSSDAVLYAPRVLAAIGAGLLFPTPMFAVQIRQRGEDVGIATSVQVFLRSLGTTFGVAIGGVIFQNQWTVQVARRITDGEIPLAYVIESNRAETAYSMIAIFPHEVQVAYQWVYAESLVLMWWVMTGMSILGFLVSLFAKDWSLRGGLAGKQNFLHRKKTPDVQGTAETR